MEFNKRLIVISNKAIEYSFYFLAIFTPLVFSPANYELFEFPKMILVYSGAALVLSLWAIKILITGKLNFAPTPLFWPILLFLISQILSTIFSIDKITSIAGYYSRFNGGLLSTIAYIVLFFTAVSNLTKNQGLTLIFLFVISGLISSIWGIPSHFGLDPTCKILTGFWTSKCWAISFDPTLRIFSTFGQPNWMAGFLAMAILIMFGFSQASKNFRFAIFGIFVNSVLFAAFLLTNSRSASLALLVSLLGFLTILIFLKFRQKLEINFASIGATLIIFAILTLFFGQNLLGRVREVKVEQVAISPQSQTQAQTPPQTSGPTESGQIRLIVWKGAIEIFKHYPSFGSGVETFGYSYYNFRPAEHNLTTEWNFLYNKAHNEFLNYAATTGILGLGSFLSIILVYTMAVLRLTFNRSNNKIEKLLIVGLFTSILSYLIHNFFGFSVISTAFFFWIILASTLIIGVPAIKLIGFKPNFSLILIPIVFLLFSVYTIVRFYLADINFAKGLLRFEGGIYQEAQTYFEKAIKLSPLPQPLFFAYQGYNLAILSQVNSSLVQSAINNVEKSQKFSKVNLTTMRLAANTYLELSSSNPYYLDRTIELANHLLKIAPTDAETHFQVAQILKIAGKDLEAEKIIKKAIELKSDYFEAIETRNSWQKED